MLTKGTDYERKVAKCILPFCEQRSDLSSLASWKFFWISLHVTVIET